MARVEVRDTIAGRLAPELGGRGEHLDTVGLDFCLDDQWLHPGETIALGPASFGPLGSPPAEVHERHCRRGLIRTDGERRPRTVDAALLDRSRRMQTPLAQG